MAKIPSEYACDYCGKRRQQDANHWFLLEAYLVRDKPAIEIMVWDTEAAIGEKTHHACGEQCALLGFQSFLATGKLDEADTVKA
jgi:hypothetical protein